MLIRMVEFAVMTLMGRAILYHHQTRVSVEVHQRIQDQPWEEPMHTRHFFRKELEMSELERLALDHSRGNVLDLGAGAGAHAIALQQRGFSVLAVDWDECSCEVMRQRGVLHVLHGDMWGIDLRPYDTIYMLMNGIGMCARVEGVERWLKKCASEMSPGARLIADSSHLYSGWDEQAIDLQDAYLGEVTFHLKARIGDEEFKESLHWIFPDVALLEAIAEEVGLHFQVLFEQADGAYLFAFTKS
jgi:SAM-dependent methyltransferase